MISNALVVYEVMGGWGGTSALGDTRTYPCEHVSTLACVCCTCCRCMEYIDDVE